MADYKPEGWHSVTPRIFARDPEGLVRFMREAFDARGELRPGVPAEVWIGDSVVMVSGDDVRRATPAFLYLYVPDADVTYQRAIACGATSREAPIDTPYGDRRAMVEDAWGNTWQIATRQGGPTA